MSDNTPLFSRRLFLNRGVQLLSAAGTLPLFLDRSAHALAADFAANPQGAGRPDRILVIVQLAGGNDGLNTIVPVRNDDYYKARPRLGIAKDKALSLSDDFGLHPAATGFKDLWDNGRMAVLHAVGYPNPNRSHFRSTDIWATAEPGKVAHTGWLGRYFDACCSGADPGNGNGAAGNIDVPPSASVALLDDPPQTLEGGKYLPIAFRSPDRLQHRSSGRRAELKAAFDVLNDVEPDADESMDAGPMDPVDDEEHRPMPKLPPGKPVQLPFGTNGSLVQDVEADDFVQRSALNARVYAETIRQNVAGVQNQASYPRGRLGEDLKLVAQMIGAGLPTRVYYVAVGGFDTHSTQLPRHQQLMDALSGSVSAFVKDLEAMGHLDRTTVMTFSEFGRRVAENGSAGTDHGAAAPLMVFGGKHLKGGFYGAPPVLAPDKLDRGDVPWSLDFRRLYATMLDTWLGADHQKVLGGKFDRIDLFKNV